MRRPSSRRSLSRRGSPPRGDRYERPRSPVRDWDRERDRERGDRERDHERIRDREWERDRIRDRERDFERRDDRSPFGARRDRTPPARSPATGPRGGSYRPRSRSASRRGGDRYQSYRRASPPRESGISSAITSQSASGRSSPRPSSVRARSPIQSREDSPHHVAAPGPALGSAAPRDAPRPAAPYDSTASAPSRSPPRGPAALRAPPTGPAANRTFTAPVSSPAPPPPVRTQTPTAPPLRSGTTSPTIPPAGPRGYVPPVRGGFPPRGGRGGWNQTPSRHMSGPSPTPSTPNGPSTIPTGPRATPSNAPSVSTPTQPRPFNPPTGPSAQHAGGARQTLAQSMLATLPPIIPGGKLDPSMTPLALGVTREVEPHYRKLRDEEEKLRDELQAKQERLRKSLYTWNRLERDSRAWELRSDLSEKSMKNMAGEGMGGAAF
ncbi:histone deacetylase 6 10 [Fusarium albosuccineum]|uniref:Histone deacetylase 6 10 n=1 Tax=Fusarium albosuccineum TaxID=1237068 RepID=A0A8H4P8T6_9HYPO|nr:histone deacetylase 6 10 [Fusarium albosuccineum]